MWMMLQQDIPDDYVIATGETHTVQEFVEASLDAVGLEGPIENYVDFDRAMVRPAEVDLLIGDASKAKVSFGWEPKVKFKELVNIMIKNDLKIEQSKDK